MILLQQICHRDASSGEAQEFDRFQCVSSILSSGPPHGQCPRGWHIAACWGLRPHKQISLGSLALKAAHCTGIGHFTDFDF